MCSALEQVAIEPDAQQLLSDSNYEVHSSA